MRRKGKGRESGKGGSAKGREREGARRENYALRQEVEELRRNLAEQREREAEGDGLREAVRRLEGELSQEAAKGREEVEALEGRVAMMWEALEEKKEESAQEIKALQETVNAENWRSA